jgi:hypothetical protein
MQIPGGCILLPNRRVPSQRIINAVRRRFGLDILADPKNFRDPETIKKLHVFPYVGDKVLNDMARGLIEAGYGTFDLEEIKAEMYGKRRLFN